MAWSEPRLRRPHAKPGSKRSSDGSGARGSAGTLASSPQPGPVMVPPLVFLLPLLLASPRPGLAGPPKPARPPLLPGQPFVVFWGIPDSSSSSCSWRPDGGSFGAVREGRVAVFYEDTLGNYPYFVDRDTSVNGGLPQHTRLDDHLQKTGEDVAAALPAPGYLGLGVLRWQEWSPQWPRNREKQTVYLEASRALLKAFFPDWTPAEVEKWAQVDFEAAAQSILTETLRELRRLRPKALWGVSPHPACFNPDPTLTQSANHTGRCPATETTLNDQLQWLWKRSSALYPLLSLEKLQGGTLGAKLLLSNQIREALRVASLPGTTYDLPVFPLVKIMYTSTNTFLSQADLVNTIGESAARGAAGVIVWERGETKTERECADLTEFVRRVLGPYAVNVTMATRLCSTSLCRGRGRCVRQNPDSSTYLHAAPPTPPTEETVTEKADGDQAATTAKPEGKQDPAEMWRKDFQCQWFQTSDEAISDQQSPEDGASLIGRGTGRTGDAAGPGGALAAKSAPSAEPEGGSTPASGSPTPSPEAPMAHGTRPSERIMPLLLLLLAKELCLAE